MLEELENGEVESCATALAGEDEGAGVDGIVHGSFGGCDQVEISYECV